MITTKLTCWRLWSRWDGRGWLGCVERRVLSVTQVSCWPVPGSQPSSRSGKRGGESMPSRPSSWLRIVAPGVLCMYGCATLGIPPPPAAKLGLRLGAGGQKHLANFSNHLSRERHWRFRASTADAEESNERQTPRQRSDSPQGRSNRGFEETTIPSPPSPLSPNSFSSVSYLMVLTWDWEIEGPGTHTHTQTLGSIRPFVALANFVDIRHTRQPGTVSYRTPSRLTRIRLRGNPPRSFRSATPKRS